MLTNIRKRWLLFQWNVQRCKHSVSERERHHTFFLFNAGLWGCRHSLCVWGGGAAGLCGWSTLSRDPRGLSHVQILTAYRSLILYVCEREWEGEEEEVRELRIFCAQNEAHPPHYRLDITRISHISTQLESSNLGQNKHDLSCTSCLVQPSCYM